MKFIQAIKDNFPRSIADIRAIPLMPLIWLSIYAGVILLVIALLAKNKMELALIPGIGIFALFFLWTRPQLTYFGILFFVPFDAYRSLLGSSITVSKLLGILALVIAGAQIILNKHKTFNIKSNIWGPIAGFVFVAVLSAMFSEYQSMSWDNVRKLLVAITFFVLTLYFVKGKDLFIYLPSVVVLGASISAVLAVYGYISKDPSFAMDVNPDALSISRGTGTSNDPNIFAMSLLFAYPIIANIAIHARHFQYRLIAGVLLVINIAAIVVTFSRGAALVLTICTFLFFGEQVRRFRPRQLGFALLVLALLGLAAVSLVPSSYWERQKSLTDMQDTSLSRRRSYLAAAKVALVENPLVGYGPGTFQEFYATTEIASRHARKSQKDYRRYAHNTFLEVAVGMGIVGFFFFLLILFTAWRDFGKAQAHYRKKGWIYESGFCLAFRVGLVGISLNFLFLSNLYGKYLWLALAVAQLCLNDADSREERVEPHRLFLRPKLAKLKIGRPAG